MKKIIVLLLIVVLLGGAAVLLKKRKQSVKNASVPTPMTHQVQVVSARNGSLEQTRPFLAQLASENTAGISSKLSGQIKEVLVRENQLVKEGELLLQIDDLEIVSSIKSLQVSLAAQKKDVHYVKSLHDRNKSLFDVGGLAREKFEASEVVYVTKQAALEATTQKIIGLEIQLDYLNIKAPFDGTVGTILSRRGDLASPGKPLLSINSPGQKLTFSYVPGDAAVKTGQEVFLAGRKIGQIKSLYSDAANGLAVAEVGVEGQLEMPNNSYVTIDLLTFAGSGCRVPIDALVQKKEGAQVMLSTDGVFSPLAVRIIASNKTQALIDPCPTLPVAVAAEAKLSQLPGFAKVRINRSESHEE